MLTPQEVSGRAFSKAAFGGYNMAMVDEFLDELTDDYTSLYKENAALKAKLKVLVDKVEEYRATEDSMRAALLTAQRMADDRRIDQRIYLLQKKPEQHRNGKLPDPRNRLSNCQILCHSCAPPVCCGYPLYHIFSNCQFNFVRIRLIYVIIFVHNGHKLCCRAAVRSRQSFFMLSLQFVLIFFSVISDSCSMLKAQKQKTHTHRKDARKGDFQYV